MIGTEPQGFIFLWCLGVSLPPVTLAVCPIGKYGPRCLSVCLCSKEGTAVCTSDRGRCICRAGYTGKLCENDINECDNLESPCHRAHMFCQNMPGSYQCICQNGYVMSGLGYCTPCPPYIHGKNCSAVCTCILERTIYCEGGYCVCKPGWGGQNCDQSVNDCAGVICPQDTVCVDGHRSHRCLCAPGKILIEGSCQEYETAVVATESSPGIGELVDVYIFYKLPEAYIYLLKRSYLPNFVYTMTIEATGQQLCDVDFYATSTYLDSHVKIHGTLTNIDPTSYNYFSNVKVIFTEAIFSVVRLVPKSEEYHEMILEIDVSHKSQAAVDCLPGMRITGTSQTLSLAVRHMRQSYLSFDVEFNQTSNCIETPRVKWTFYSIPAVIVTYYPMKCMDGRHVKELDVNALIEKANESVISDHKSLKEIIPKATLPIGYVLISLLAYVHRDRRQRASAFGYFEIRPSYVIEGNIFPYNKDLFWSSDYPLNLTADFVEPDVNSELEWVLLSVSSLCVSYHRPILLVLDFWHS